MIVERVRVSRALRAFFVVIGGWSIMRIVVLWPASVGVAWPAAKAVLTAPAQAIPSAGQADLPAPVIPITHGPLSTETEPGDLQGKTAPASVPLPVQPNARDGALPAPRSEPTVAALEPLLFVPSSTARFSGSAWTLFRPDSSGAALGTGGTLGGSQAGVRLFYNPGLHWLALTARLSAPLSMKLGREASVGVGLRGRRAGVLLERRVALDRGARNAMSLTAYGGISNVALSFGLQLEGYAQFGVVGARSRDGFVDGAVGIAHPLAEVGDAKISVGGALSGGAQPGVRRVDIGPELIGSIPVSGKSVRITAGWRQRIAGNAAPGSGPSLTIGVGF